ncbi:MFS transporter [Lichenicola sp.]|uniref:MFS transporter n=1 Tax=Lichenicola sp. TaxID=2804529 RepID=UPI003B00959C
MAAAVIGNTLEVFDFIAYGTFAVMIGRTFFPTHDDYLSLLLSVSTFGVGFVTRPLGAILVGLLADRHGRRHGMMISLGLMGLGSLMIAVLPGYASIGPWAPALLVLARLIQGIAWGAEAGPATTYLLENAPPGRSGLYASWQGASQSLAVLGAGLIGYVATLLLGPGAMAEWGWRLPFALGVLVVPVGLALRRGLEEVPVTQLAEPGSSRVGQLFSAGRGKLLCALMLLIAGTVSQYFLNYITTYALAVLHLPTGLSLLGTVIVGGCGAIAALVAGHLSDRIGRIPVILVPRLALGLLIVPLLLLLTGHPAGWLFGLVAALVTVLQVGSFAGSVVLLVELFPPQVRSTGFGTLYAIAISLFGGTAQIVFTTLIHWTHDPVSPAWYLAVVNLVAALAALGLRGPRGVPAQPR